MLKLFHYMKPYRTAVILVLLFTFFQCLSDLYLPTLMADIVDIGIVKETSLIFGALAALCCWLRRGHDLLYCRELSRIQIGYRIRENPSRARVLPCREFYAAGVRQDRHGLADYPYDKRYYAGAAGHDHDPSHDGDCADDVYRGHRDGRVERSRTDNGAVGCPAGSGTCYFPDRQKAFRSSKRFR